MLQHSITPHVCVVLGSVFCFFGFIYLLVVVDVVVVVRDRVLGGGVLMVAVKMCTSGSGVSHLCLVVSLVCVAGVLWAL